MSRSVFLVTDSYDFGGAENAVLTLVAGIDRSRWEPTLVHHPAAGLRPLVEGAHSLDVPTLSVPPMPEGVEGARRLARFVAELRRRRPDVVHFHLTWQFACRYPLMGAVLARLPSVATVQLFVEAQVPRRVASERRLLTRGVGRYIAVSEHVRAQLEEGLGWPARKIEVVPNAVDVQSAQRRPDPDLRARLLRGGDGPLVLVPARLATQKGHRHLLRAAVEVPSATFALAGEGSERQALEELARTLGIADRIVFLGYRGDVPDLLAVADLVVLPSLFEGLPIAVLEAMAAGRPVIATQIGGTEEALISGENGLLVPPADPAALAAAISGLLSNPERAGRLARAGRLTVERDYSSQATTERVCRVYDDVIAGRPLA